MVDTCGNGNFQAIFFGKYADMPCRRDTFGQIADFTYPRDKIFMIFEWLKYFFLDNILAKTPVSAVNGTAGNVQIADALNRRKRFRMGRAHRHAEALYLVEAGGH
jgi:hypothetical protein